MHTITHSACQRKEMKVNSKDGRLQVPFICFQFACDSAIHALYLHVVIIRVASAGEREQLTQLTQSSDDPQRFWTFVHQRRSNANSIGVQ